MIDIPRNELLDKLAAGWKVRTKAYGKNTLNTLEELQGIDLKCLIEDDWEGEPPGPVLRSKNCDIVFAFNELQNHGAKFICRPSWREQYDDWTPIESAGGETLLETRDILANDWEVWG